MADSGVAADVTASGFRADLCKRLQASGDRVLLRILPHRGGAPVELTGPEIVRRGLELARRSSDVPERGVVLLLLPHSVELFLLHIGLVLTGRLPAVLAWPTTRVDARKYHSNLLHQLGNLPATELLTLPGLAQSLDPGLPYGVRPCAIAGGDAHEKGIVLAFEGERRNKHPTRISPDTPAEALFLQFSGGTTGLCVGHVAPEVVVTAPMLEHQLGHLAPCLSFDPLNDAVASWLPLYHDMGLIACLWLPLWSGAPSLHLAASDWLLAPDLLFRALDEYQATFCWLPNFAFSYLAGARDRMTGPYRLGHVRGFINCSEPVRARTFADWGVHDGQLQASYAMAETVFAVTQTSLGRPPASHPRNALRGRRSELAFDLVDDTYLSSGATLPGVELRIRGAGGDLVGDGQGFQRNALAAEGWYTTGDYGFSNAGELFVIGRTKDIIIVGGQNVFPEDVEAIIGAIEGIYPGRTVAFGVADDEQGTEGLCIVAEMRGAFDDAAAEMLAANIRSLVVAAIGIAPRFVWVKPERWIVKSTAGKISRTETRNRFLEERAASLRE